MNWLRGVVFVVIIVRAVSNERAYFPWRLEFELTVYTVCRSHMMHGLVSDQWNSSIQYSDVDTYSKKLNCANLTNSIIEQSAMVIKH